MRTLMGQAWRVSRSENELAVTATLRKASFGSAAAIAALLFGVFVAANAFFLWSADAWFHFLGPPPGLVNPIVDKWIIMPLALLAWGPQFLSYGLFDYIEKLRHFDAAGSVVIVSLLSTVTYTPAILWAQARRRKRRAA
jgi:hypothetical protein